MDIVTLSLAKAYTDSQRLGYKETETKVLLPETELTFVMNEDFGFHAVVLDAPFALNVGDKVTVMWDGVPYVCEYSAPGLGVGMFGNSLLFGAGDSGEPFFYVDVEGVALIGAFAEGKHIVCITAEIQTVHPIKYEYLPIITVNTLIPKRIDSSAVELSAEESEAIKAVTVKQVPAMIRFRTIDENMEINYRCEMFATFNYSLMGPITNVVYKDDHISRAYALFIHCNEGIAYAQYASM